MRRIRFALAALLSAMAAVAALAAPPAVAAEAPQGSAGQQWALKVDNLYVTVDAGADGDMKLRAKGTTAAGWEKFTLHTDYVSGSGFGASVIFRSEATGRYVTAEDDASGNLLRTRVESTGSWQRFSLVPLTTGEYGLKAHNGKFVAAELGTYPDRGLLRARTDRPASELGAWERFTLEPISAPQSDPTHMPAPSTPAVKAHNVVSWNICANNNTDCPLKYAPPTTMAPKVATALFNALGTRRPDAIFFQEICEKQAKPLELALEDKWPGLDVRFMPTYYKVTGTNILAQKNCSDGTDNADRGAFGIALAVSDSNTWYQGTVLPSPDKPVPDKKEQRPMLCAVVPDEGSAYCNAHFSSGPYINSDGKLVGDDSDPNNLFRPKQAAEMRSQVGNYTAAGYTTYYGGDLNTTSADVNYLDSLYSSGQECGQTDPTKPHTGAPTDGSNKIDYVFGPRGLKYTCRVTDPALSDHRIIEAETS